MRSDLDALAKQLAEADGQRIFGYCRISSSKQEQGLSLPAQEEAICEYCKKHKLGEPLIVTETSSAGQRMFQLPRVGGPATPSPLPSDGDDEDEPPRLTRPRFLLLLGHLTALKNAQLVVWRLDRIARINDEREVIHQLCVRNEVKLHSTDPSEQLWLEHGDPNDPMAALMRQIFGAFSQYEKAIIEMRMQTGMRFKAARGGFTGGRPAFGYTLADGDLAVVPEDAAVVRYIFMLSKKYHLTLNAIRDQLAGKVSRTKIHRVLHNESLYRGKYRDRYGAVHDRPDLRILTDDGDYDYDEEFRSG